MALKDKRLFITCLLALLLVLLIPIVLVMKHDPKYVYPVRERIDQQSNSVSWELWCWSEYSNGHISKDYIGRFVTVGTNQVGDRVETNLCGKR